MLADEAKGIIFADPGQLTVAYYLDSWLYDTARYQVRDSTFNRNEQACPNHLCPFFDRLSVNPTYCTRSDQRIPALLLW